MGGEEQALAATEEACRVYVGNLLPKAKESHLSSKFSRFGTIHSVWIARRPPGFAFVRFASPEAAQRAVEACSDEGAMEILGKAVRVQMAGDKNGNEAADESQSHARSKRRGGESVDRDRRSRSWRRESDRRRRSRSRSPPASNRYRRDRHRYRSRDRPRSRSKSESSSRSRGRRGRRDSSHSTSRDAKRKGRRRVSRSSSRSRQQTKLDS